MGDSNVQVKGPGSGLVVGSGGEWGGCSLVEGKGWMVPC